eukprot:CAMPEP_0118657912 /NCGR_PEP_ID=MMETSP0785-20121206/14278_1 /TAXON_ID=91992 /ORGANISM="Bolidomonas pacifica, Strain CCMP 1866" /LENGTH=81 /DNA_ID=CAMNT_0006550875 /DNA_START=157 /DNA_END=402 /DNA_ORIENTATION=-
MAHKPPQPNLLLPLRQSLDKIRVLPPPLPAPRRFHPVLLLEPLQVNFEPITPLQASGTEDGKGGVDGYQGLKSVVYLGGIS